MENEAFEKNILSLEDTIKEQLDAAAKWARFISVVYLFWGSVILLAMILLLANFDELINQIIKYNGMSDEMIKMFEENGKAASSVLLLIMSGIMYINGILLFLFSRDSKNYLHQVTDIETLSNAFKYLQYYLLVSFILACLSAIPAIMTIFFYFGTS